MEGTNKFNRDNAFLQIPIYIPLPLKLPVQYVPSIPHLPAAPAAAPSPPSPLLTCAKEASSSLTSASCAGTVTAQSISRSRSWSPWLSSTRARRHAGGVSTASQKRPNRLPAGGARRGAQPARADRRRGHGTEQGTHTDGTEQGTQTDGTEQGTQTDGTVTTQNRAHRQTTQNRAHRQTARSRH